MMTSKTILIIACLFSQLATKKSQNLITLNNQTLTAEFKTNFDLDTLGNNFVLKLADTSVIRNRLFFLILESENPDFVLSIMDADKDGLQGPTLMDLTTFSGNLVLAMSDTFFGAKLDFFQKSGLLKFRVSNKSKSGSKDYRLEVIIAEELSLTFGKIYTTRTDINIKILNVKLHYNGLNIPDLQKLRFQITSVRQKKDYSLSASIEHEGQYFELNTIFPKTIGGILSLPQLPVCLKELCSYQMTLQLSSVKLINIESYLIGNVEQLSIQHYEEYYDRVFEADKITFYELPYEESMNEMDITISLIPVVGTTGLYANIRTLPLKLENFDWKEKGLLAKRITIKWSELVQMRGEKSNIFIAVATSRPGEYLLKLDAHDPGYKGRLNSGIIESGFVQYDEYNNYLYFFEVYETQEIAFSVSLNVISGDANLYLKQCFTYSDCLFNPETGTQAGILKIENNQNSKVLSHQFNCEYNPKNIFTTCQFVIGVQGKENHGTHFEITLQEHNFHRLMVPGHSVPLNLSANQRIYLKFSHPSRSKSSKLFLSVEALWGSFDVSISKFQQFPTPQTPDTISETFIASKLGLYNSLKSIYVDPSKLGGEQAQGIYYVTIYANTSCSTHVKFYEKSDAQITIHTLVAGTQVRGEIRDSSEISYYTIKVSLESRQASSVSVYLTPLKGQYIMFANKNGNLPTLENKEFYSMNNHLELSYQMDENTHDEYIIGVKLNTDTQKLGDESYQFMINLSYSNKALRLNPGIISQYMLSKNNYFFIEVADEMKSLLILKSIVDGFTIKMCAWFSSIETSDKESACTHTADDLNVAIYITEAEINQYCNRNAQGRTPQRCFVQIKIDGIKSQTFSIGFNYNDHSFQLTKHLIVTGPMLINTQAQINFIFHSEPNKPAGIYFNSKGRNLNFYTKIVRGDSFDDQIVVNFPNSNSYDAELHKKNGYVTNVFYNESTVANYGNSPEILISIRAAQGGEPMFDPSHHFLLQVSMDAKEILRTQTHSEDVVEEIWNYFTFYNNGNSDTLRVYVSTTVMTRLEVLLSRGLQSRPPYTNKPIASKVGMGSVELSLNSIDLKTDPHSDKENLKGHYALAVKSSGNCNLNIFWNNKDEHNYIEITPNQPMTMALDSSRKFYFSFYARDVNEKLAERGVISIYVKTNVKASVYVIKTTGDLQIPTSTEFTWKGTLPNFGGITVIQIKPDHLDYCVECLYIGNIETEEDGQVSMLVNIKHSGIPIELTPGFTFPEMLLPKEKSFYKIFNSDSGQIDLSISMISGFIGMYLSPSQDLNEVKFEESYLFENNLDVHKFIPIAPSKYNINGPHDYYILITNTRMEPASFTLTVDKNSIKSPIEPGITKFLHLGPSEATDFIYTPKEKETIFEVRFELRQVLDENYKQNALESVSRIVSLYHIDESDDRFLMKVKKISVSENKVYISFDISENTKGTFAIHLMNPINCPIAVTVDLLNGGYKLLNFNQFTVDRLRKGENILYEGYGDTSKYLYVDLKMCHGEIDMEFFQADFENVAKQNTTESKKIIDSNSMVHYIKPEHERVFFRVKNKKETKAIYEISVFNEKDLENNPYSEVAQENNGKVDVELDNEQVLFAPLSISSTYSSDFYHVVNYTLILSNDVNVLNYGKNCGNFMIDHVFKNYHMLSFSHTTTFRSTAEIAAFRDKIKIKIEGLIGNTKYHGIVVARIDLFPKEGGFMSPTRTGKIYYDEFVFITAKYNIPFNLLISVLVCFCFFCFLFCIVKSYIFGSINKMKNFERLTDLSGFDEGVLGMNIISMLEKEYYDQEGKHGTTEKSQEKEVNIVSMTGVNTIEMTEPPQEIN